MKKQTINKPTKALIYCRVSSERQVNEGNGLASQEQRCMARAKELSLPVVSVFRDEGVSGGLFDRPAMQQMMIFLDRHKEEIYVVIFDDLKRFARQVDVHLQLKAELVTKRKSQLVCLNFNFEESPVGRALETIVAATAQLERE